MVPNGEYIESDKVVLEQSLQKYHLRGKVIKSQFSIHNALLAENDNNKNLHVTVLQFSVTAHGMDLEWQLCLYPRYPSSGSKDNPPPPSESEIRPSRDTLHPQIVKSTHMELTALFQWEGLRGRGACVNIVGARLQVLRSNMIYLAIMISIGDH